MASNDVATLLQQVTRLDGLGWAEFRQKRAESDLMIQRRAPVDLPPQYKDFSKNLDIQSPDLEEALSTRVQIKMIRPTKIDAVSLDAATKAKQDVEDCRIWYGYQWARVNKNRRLDRARSEAQDRYGVFVERMYWKQPTEPEVEDGDDGAERLTGYAEQGDNCFDIRPVNPTTMSWFPLSDPSLFFEHVRIPYVEAKELTNADGEYLRLDNLNNMFFLGDPSAWDNAHDSSSRSQEFHVVTRAQKNRKTGKWTIAEYVYPDGATTDGIGTLSETEVPFNHSPYFIGLSGSHKVYEVTPHLMYRPSLYPLIVDVAEENQWRTIIAALAIDASTNAYVDLSAMRPELMSFLEELYPGETAGTSRRLVFRKNNPASGELSAFPHLEPYPNELDSALLQLHADTKENKKRHLPNRFQTGDMGRTEVAEGKATTMVNAYEASSLPYTADLQLQDPVTVEELECMGQAICYWDDGVTGGSQKLYPATTTGGEPLLKGGPDAGTQVVVNATKLARPHQIYVLTRNQTQAEEEREALMAFQDYAQGVITFDKLLVRRGETDPERAMLDLDRDRARKLNQPGVDHIIQQAITTLWMANSGLNIAALQGSTIPTPPQEQQPPGQEPVQLSPAHNPAGSPQYRPSPPPPRLQPLGSNMTPTSNPITGGSSGVMH